jgi:hypothetical protein
MIIPGVPEQCRALSQRFEVDRPGLAGGQVFPHQGGEGRILAYPFLRRA